MISTSLLAAALFMQATTTDTTATDTLGRVVPLPAVEVSTTRLEAASPYARSTMDRAAIERANWGQDTPMALSTLPGAYAYSDAGNGIGYSYLFIRGFPQRRISVLVNGVPLNDPESHEVYWIDHPDLLASTAEAQVQRGVGSALYGAASVGGSVSLETMPLAAAPTFRATAGYGSFDTKRVMIEGISGPLASGWNLYGRYSRIESDGYRDRSDTKLWSYALSVQHAITANQWSRINLYGGPEETHLAYLGIPQSYLDGGITGDADRDRRYNPITYEGERDHFFEPHYELLHHWALSPTANLSQTLFYFDGEGFYDERRLGQSLSDYRLSPWATSDSTLFPRHYYAQDTTGALVQDGSGNFTVERFDAVRKRFIRNRHYGWVPRLQLRRDAHTLTVGGELRAHDGRHIGSVISGSGLPPGTEPDHVYYDYHPRTLSTGLFMREEWSPSASLAWTLDLAWRHQGYFMRGDQFDGIEFDQSYDFGLPRLGVRWRPRADLTLFAAAGHSRREPAFRDLYDAEGAGSVPLFANGEPLVEPEKVMDYEAGVSWTSARAQLGANLFRMDFEDELVYAGQFNTDLGYPILGNAARSVHQGIELTAAAGAPASPFLLTANATLSDNHFVEYREHYGPTPGDEVSYDGNAIGFFPGALANASARAAWRNATLEVAAQYAGRMYLDNTESKDASIGPRTVVNLNAGWRFSTKALTSAELALRIFNLLDRRYATSGYMDYDAGGNLVPQFIPAATRHWLAELRLGF
ncbi:MAG TPA: TonB-dependent receptor [Candidatus Eisenbacteria bacterium]|nr:TonB-dependent receptor [Candidatus Eisenbacteria bacterium]